MFVVVIANVFALVVYALARAQIFALVSRMLNDMQTQRKNTKIDANMLRFGFGDDRLLSAHSAATAAAVDVCESKLSRMFARARAPLRQKLICKLSRLPRLHRVYVCVFSACILHHQLRGKLIDSRATPSACCIGQPTSRSPSLSVPVAAILSSHALCDAKL